MSRPKRRGGVTYEVETPYGKLFVTITSWAEDQRPLEMFGSMSKANPETSTQLAALCRLGSRALQAGLPPKEIVASWRGLMSGQGILWETIESSMIPGEAGVVSRQIRSIPDALACILDLYERERLYVLDNVGERVDLGGVVGVERVPDEEILVRGAEGWQVSAQRLRFEGFEVLRVLEESGEDEASSV